MLRISSAEYQVQTTKLCASPRPQSGGIISRAAVLRGGDCGAPGVTWFNAEQKCEPHAASTLAHQHFRARCRSVHAACVACGDAGGVGEASNWVYERVRRCTDRKGGRGSGAYHPTSAVTRTPASHQLSFWRQNRVTLDRL